MTKLIRLAAALSLASCAVEDLATDSQDLVGSTPTDARPEVVRFVSFNGHVCTATMLSPTAFLTAANCIDFAAQQTGGTITTETGSVFLVKQAFSQGGAFGNDDIAVGQLTAPMTLASYATIATREPHNETLTDIGYGCTTYRDDYTCVGNMIRSFVTYFYDGADSEFYGHGDGGAPTFLGALSANGPIVRVASNENTTSDKRADIGADTVTYRAQILGLATGLTSSPLAYRSHVQSLGWMPTVGNGAVSGTTQSLRLEALQIWAQNPNESICYSVRIDVSPYKWSDEVCDGALVGTVGQATSLLQLRIERHVGAARWPINYRVYLQGLGWQPWVSDYQAAATGIIEAIQIDAPQHVAINPPGGTGLN